jgi:putative DNA primase/helicase
MNFHESLEYEKIIEHNKFAIFAQLQKENVVLVDVAGEIDFRFDPQMKRDEIKSKLRECPEAIARFQRSGKFVAIPGLRLTPAQEFIESQRVTAEAAKHAAKAEREAVELEAIERAAEALQSTEPASPPSMVTDAADSEGPWPPFEEKKSEPKAKVKPKRAPKVEAEPAQPKFDVEDEPAGEVEHDEVDDGNGETEISIPSEKRPCFRVFDRSIYVLEHEWLAPAVYHFTKSTKGDQEILKATKVCSPLHVEAIASDEQGNNYGRVLRFVTPRGKWRTWAMPMELLAGSADVLREELLGMGVIINSEARAQLTKYLTDEKPTLHFQCATQVGWCGNSFVLPDVVIGPKQDSIIFQSGERAQAEYGTRGTLEGWKKEVSARAIGNPVLMTALSAAFVGPLLDKVGAESGGVHMVGSSSTGKSSALKAAASVWGGPKHVRSWNSTANGMEGVAALFNDSLLPLDEINECAAKDIDRIIYAIANGVGRQRASRSGSARSVTRWRCFVLSSGERMVSTAMATAGIVAKAGQLVRLIDLPVQRQHGVWDDLQNLPSGGALSDAVKEGAAKHHGKAGREFLEHLTHDNRKWPEAYAELKKAAFAAVDDDDGQAARVAGRFALIALAGDVATEYGITGWSAGEATNAASIMFQTWRAQRQTGNVENLQILEQVAAFIDRHGDARFSEIGVMSTPLVRERAGWWRNDRERGRVYWFTNDGLREALNGYDFQSALDVLIAVGALPERKGSPAVPSRGIEIPGQPTTKRLYPVTQGRL